MAQFIAGLQFVPGLPAVGTAGQSLRILSLSAGLASWEFFTPATPVTPGGATTQVQYNNAGAFAGSVKLVWINADSVLTVGDATQNGTVSAYSATLAVDGTGVSGRQLSLFGGSGSPSAFEDAATPAGNGEVVLVRGGTGGQTFNIADTGGSGGQARVFGGARGTGPGPGVSAGVMLGHSASTDVMEIKRGGQVRFVPLSADPAVVVGDGDRYYSTPEATDRVRSAGAWRTVPLLERVNTFTAVNTFSAAVVLSPAALTVISNLIATNASLGNNFTVTLNANATLSNPTNPTDMQQITWRILQDGTGSRTLALGSKFSFGTDLAAILISTAVNSITYVAAKYYVTTDKWHLVGQMRGFT